MKKIYILLLTITVFSNVGTAVGQNIGVGTTAPNTSAQLDITSTSRGLLIPRMTTAAVNAISNPARGLMVYDSTRNQLVVNMGTAAAPSWQSVVNGSGWSLSGNSGTNPSNQFIGSTDNKALNFRVNNIQAGAMDPVGNVFWGLRAGQSSSGAYSNIAVGTDALKTNTAATPLVAIGDSALMNNGRGTDNVAVGYKALLTNTQGYYNIAIGSNALANSAVASFNVGIGHLSLQNNISGDNNTAIGAESMIQNTIGSNNTAVGMAALLSNTTGYYNIALGPDALGSNTIGSSNIAVGVNAMGNNTEGNSNTAMGFYSAISNSTGSYNCALGYKTLQNNVAGSSNVAIGNQALFTNNDSYNVAVGQYALYNTTTSEYNTAIGFNAGGGTNHGYNNVFLGANTGTNGDGYYNCIAIGQGVFCSGSSQVRIGNGATVSIGGNVSWSTLSDGRVKKDITENVKGLDFIMRLRPVTYRLDMNILQQRQAKVAGAAAKQVSSSRPIPNDNENKVLTGFVAQEVEQASKAAGYDFAGVDKPQNENDLYGLRYSDFVAPLVKSVQELNAIVSKQQAFIDALQQRIAELEKQQKH